LEEDEKDVRRNGGVGAPGIERCLVREEGWVLALCDKGSTEPDMGDADGGPDDECGDWRM